MSMSCFDCHDYMDGYNYGKKEGVIEELENLRDEMQHDYDSLECLDDSDIGYGACILRYIKEINNRIEELKGE